MMQPAKTENVGVLIKKWHKLTGGIKAKRCTTNERKTRVGCILQNTL